MFPPLGLHAFKIDKFLVRPDEVTSIVMDVSIRLLFFVGITKGFQ